jgi:hypothetical protein
MTKQIFFVFSFYFLLQERVKFFKKVNKQVKTEVNDDVKGGAKGGSKGRFVPLVGLFCSSSRSLLFL